VCSVNVFVVNISTLHLLFLMIDTVDFSLFVVMSVVSPTTKVEHMQLKHAVAMTDEAVLGALSLVLVVMRGGLIPLPIHASLRHSQSLSSTVCLDRLPRPCGSGCKIERSNKS
jgi:hypothetical protein